MNADELFEKGLALLKEDNPLGALVCFEKAYGIKKNPELQSYLGFCIAVERGKVNEGMGLCENALAQEPDNPVHYLNIGRICMKAGKKDRALDFFRKGLSFGNNQEIKTVLENLGIRKKPVLPFLSRDNFLNKYLGMLFSRLKLR